MVTSEVGTYLEIAFDDWGSENFKKEIICLCKDEDEMEQMESYLIEENVKRGIKTYNIRGVYENLGFGKKWTDDKKKHHSNRMKALWSDPEWVSKRPKTFVRCPDEEPLKGKPNLSAKNKPNQKVKDAAHQKRLEIMKNLSVSQVRDDRRAYIEAGLPQFFVNTNRDGVHQLFQECKWTLVEGTWIAPTAQEV